MRFASLLATLLFVSVAGAGGGLTSETIESHNAAAGFAGTQKFAIGRAARNCRDLLGKDDAWMHAIVSNWMERNGRYAVAGDAWTSALLTGIARSRGREQAEAAAREIVGIVRASAEELVELWLGKTDEDRRRNCASYERTAASGRYDIPKDAPIFKELEALVAYMGAPESVVQEEQPADVKDVQPRQ